MLEMPIREPNTVAYVEELTKRLNDIMEKRVGALDYNHDFTALEKALQELQQSYIEQHYSDASAKSVCDCIRAEVKAMLGKEFVPLTTWEMNERLSALIASSTKGLDELIALQKAQKAIEEAAKAYAELLAEIDAEVSFDAQIAMAEDAISKQLGIKCPCAYLEMNAVLGNYARVLRLMKRGAVVSTEDATTLLVGATYLGQVAMFKRALELKADVNAPAVRDPRARPALLVAIEKGNTEFLRLIHEAKGLQTVTDANGNTALHYAMKNGNLAVARVLAKAVDVTAVNKKGETALFTAVRRNQAKPVEFLINLIKADDEATTAAKRKAFVDLKNLAGEDAFTVACRADVHMVLDPLFAAGAEFNTSHLVEAAAANRIAIAQWLVEHGADVNADGVMAAAFGSPDGEDTVTYKYLVHEGGVALKRTPKCCKETREALEKCKAEKKAESCKKNADDVQASVVGNITFDVKKNK
jgi:ankyrin repeat protein